MARRWAPADTYRTRDTAPARMQLGGEKQAALLRDSNQKHEKTLKNGQKKTKNYQKSSKKWLKID
jgi:hypothetical protein